MPREILLTMKIRFEIMLECLDSIFRNLQPILGKVEYLTTAGVIIATYAYSETVKAKYDSILQNLKTFKAELDKQKDWLKTPYSENHEDKLFFSPRKIVYPLFFQSSKNILSQSIFLINSVDDNFYHDVALFNERIDLFNSLLEYHKMVISANPIFSKELYDYLNKLGLNNCSVPFIDLKSKLRKKARCSKKLKRFYLFSTEIYRLNNLIHAKIIGADKDPTHLNYLFMRICDTNDKLINRFDKLKPFVLKNVYFGLLVVGILACSLLNAYFKK